MGGARLERAVDCLLPLDRGDGHGRVANLPLERAGLASLRGPGGTLMKIVLVAAIGENNVIGRDGQLPWRLKSDLQHFRQVTLNRPVIMGRKTYESIGKPLPGPHQYRADPRSRLWSRPARCWPPAWMRRSPSRAGRRQARRRRNHGDRRQRHICRTPCRCADRLEITHVHAAPEGDAVFPPIDPAVWQRGLARGTSAGPDDERRFRASRPM